MKKGEKEEDREDPRFKLGTRDMWSAVALYLIFWTIECVIAWWGMTKPGISYIIGLPDWFFWGFLPVHLIFIGLAILMAAKIKETPLTPWLEEEE